MLVPDSNLELQPLPRVLLNDAPWLVPRLNLSKVRLAWAGLTEHRPLVRALRLRPLSAAVFECVERKKMASGGRPHIALSALFRGLGAVRATQKDPAPPLRHRLLWLLDLQLSADALKEQQEWQEGGGGVRRWVPPEYW